MQDNSQQIATQATALQLLRRKTIRDQEKLEVAVGEAQPLAGNQEEWVISGVADVTAVGIDLQISMGMHFNTGEDLLCQGALSGFGFLAAKVVYHAYCEYSAQQLRGTDAVCQIAFAGGNGQISLWQGGSVVAVILLTGIGVGFAGGGGTVKLS